MVCARKSRCWGRPDPDRIRLVLCWGGAFSSATFLVCRLIPPRVRASRPICSLMPFGFGVGFLRHWLLLLLLLRLRLPDRALFVG